MQISLGLIKNKVKTVSYTMLALRLSVFAFSCFTLYGVKLYLAASACTLAAITLYAYAKSNKILLKWCQISAVIIWTVSTVIFSVTNAPLVLILLLFIMLVLDGFIKPG